MTFLFRITILLTVMLGSSSTRADEGDAYFRDHVEPILAHRCYHCHSHQSGEMEGGLTLDWKSGWEQGGSRGPAIVPGEPDASLMIRAILHVDEHLQMPPDKMPDDEIAILKEWVQRGAIDPRVAQPEAKIVDDDWWSLKPLNRPQVPVASGKQDVLHDEPANAQNPIDAFVADQIRQKGHKLSGEADRRTLLRRLSVDLRGMLPTWDELDAFIQDTDPLAYEKLVDRYLASPQYGERWGRHWLDTIHFADSHGYEHDVFRPNAWRFRDYVIRSLNDDKPWSQFIREQMAVDFFHPDHPEWTPALGFLGAGVYDHSAAATAPKAFEYLDRDDMVTQTMAALVSTTANCARCHAHKFDPITQEDYFALQAVFAGIGKGDITYDADATTAQQRSRWSQLAKVMDDQHEVLLREENQTLVAQWDAAHRNAAQWQPLAIDAYLSSVGTELRQLADGSILSGGKVPETDIVTVVAKNEPRKVTALRLDLLTDESLPAQGPGRAENGNLHLNEVTLTLFTPSTPLPQSVAIRNATADFEQAGWTVAHAIDGNEQTGWGIHPSEGHPHFAVFELAQPLTLGPDDTLTVTLKQTHGRGHVIGRFRLSVTDAPPEATIALPTDVAAAFAIDASQRSKDQQAKVSAYALRTTAETELKKLPELTKVYAAGREAANERGLIRIETPREIRVLKRGDVEQPMELAMPGALTAVRSLDGRFALDEDAPESARRAALANWIVHSQNPLTWRSIANRVWHYHFGQGLCNTPNDFGRMGALPTHPELLDWLACELRDSGGSLKHLTRLICTSKTYRQGSHATAEQYEVDPENKLLGRMNRQRLDADSFRDAVLAVSQQLDMSMGGPGIAHFSTSPGAQLTPMLDYSQYDFDSFGATRRSIYRVVWRGIPDPFMEALDFPDLGLLAPVRGFSASALQSLTLLNNRFILHHAQHLARRAEAASSSREDQIRSIVRWVWLREPTSSELQKLVGLAEQHQLESVCRLLLNSNEFLFVD